MAKTKRQSDIERLAISIVREEKQRWEDAVAFVTENIAFKMRDLVRVCRKNYYGIFDAPYDESTGREKLWYPLTEIFVEAVVKNYDLDQKDVGFRAKTDKGYAMTDITRSVVVDYLDKMFFGEVLDGAEHTMAIDGTVVWKTYEVGGKMRRSDVDLLNVYIDPTSPSIQEAYRFTERSLQFVEDVQRMSGWMNTEDIEAVEGLPRTDPTYNTNNKMSNVKMLDVYETWGKVPLYLFTGKKADMKVEVDAQLVVSGIDTPGRERVHLIERNKKKDSFGNALKPYEEAWYKKVPGRWYGKGISEMLIPFQIYANLTLNMRVNRGIISQMGLFKVRKGSGITPQMLSRLPSNGAVVVQTMDDIQQMAIADISPSSYKDEDVIKDVAQRLTSAFDVIQGEALPSSTPATNAAIQNQNAKSMFTMIREQLGSFLKRWMDRHALPIIAENISVGDIIRIQGDDERLKDVFERLVAYQAFKDLEKYSESLSRGEGTLPTDAEMRQALVQAEDKLRRRGDIFIELIKKIMASEVDTEIYYTNETIDVAVITDRLMNLIKIAPEYRDQLVNELFDLMGIPKPKMPAQQPQPAQPVQGQLPSAPQNLQQIITPSITRHA